MLFEKSALTKVLLLSDLWILMLQSNGTLHQGQRGRIDNYARVTRSLLDPILTMSLEHKCQYALFHPDVMCHYTLGCCTFWLGDYTIYIMQLHTRLSYSWPLCARWIHIRWLHTRWLHIWTLHTRLLRTRPLRTRPLRTRIDYTRIDYVRICLNRIQI